MEEERVLEPTTDTTGERPYVEGRRRTLRKDYAPPSWEGQEDRMETSQEQQPVMRQPSNEENGRPIGGNMDAEGVTLEWSIGGTEEGRLAPQDGMQETATATSPKRPPKIEDRQKGRKSSGATVESIEDYGNHFPLRTKCPPPP